ncbi:hypothetical protein A2955_02900 [Candidatus Woesebacteria bacterium RIFCSPLOWO2_01_FULL_37_19]|uniref:Uncharacterized protein n=1 Tax=Candidatus Woesebacteria bacterium RIFCSPLOWO2_01_FULL_37_19 TaxID=1802514 RepID=A0A1F8B1U9_9BACT|nr:MAG: hypothetical protein A2955_02900 [Candidatus Woesebacteria bacterium RIFCSPLOWO2_01_FULL_37_19]
MSDQLAELQTIEQVEGMSLRDRLKEGVFDSLYGRIGGGFRYKLGELLSQKQTEERDIALANLQKYLATTLYYFGEDLQIAKEWDKRLDEILLGENKRSVVNVLGENKRALVEAHLLGPISALTLIDLIKRSDPSLKSGLRPSEIFVGGKRDVYDKVDLVFRFNTKTSDGKPVVRLVQLKSIPEVDARVARIVPGELKNNYFGLVRKDEAEKLINYSKDPIYKDAQVKAFVILVPAFDSSVVNNIYGIIRASTKEGRDLIDVFRTEAVEQGFLPRLKTRS